MNRTTIREIESRVCEGYQYSTGKFKPAGLNIFGRPVTSIESTDISTAIGMCSTGLRIAVEVESSDLAKNTNAIANAARQHIALVVHTNTNSQVNLQPLAAAGCVILLASNEQQQADFTLIAHRIAELALVPVILVSDSFQKAAPEIPTTELISSYLGAPSIMIDTPTPAQEMIFGDKRRSVPNWFNLNFPATNGIEKNGLFKAFSASAKNEYFQSHTPDLTKKAIKEYNQLTGRNYSAIDTYNSPGSRQIIISTGMASETVTGGIKEMAQADKRLNTGCIDLNVVNPLPESELIQALKGVRQLTLLENVVNGALGKTPLFLELLALLRQSNSNTKLLGGLYNNELHKSDVKAAVENMSGAKKDLFYLGIEFTHNSSSFPKHDVLLGNIKRKYPNLSSLSLTGNRQNASSTNFPKKLPLTIRHYKDQGPEYTKLSRFYNDTAIFYGVKDDRVHMELVADPYQALDNIPAASASLASYSSQRESIPQFIPDKCTGCGDCFVSCPHSAIPPLVISLEELMKAGASLAGKKGQTTIHITPVVKMLAKMTATKISENSEQQTEVGAFLQSGFDALSEQAGWPEEKASNITSDFKTILEEIASLPVAITSTFFEISEAREQGSGELFTLAIDPGACTGCGICSNVCKDEALVMSTQTPELLNETQKSFDLWELLPDTSGETIKRLHSEPDYDSFAAILLSRNFYLSMTGGTADLEAAPSKQILHLVTALTESVTQTQVVEEVKEVKTLIKGLNENVHSMLVEALPKDQFDSLKEVVGGSSGKMTPFDQVIGQLGDRELMKQIDTFLVRRKIELLDNLKSLQWLIEEGPTGTGRARYSMVVNAEDNLGWVNSFPFNVFTVPVQVCNKNESLAERAEGVFLGQLRYVLDNIKLLRRAKLEVKNKYDQHQHDEEIANLSWKDLTEEERAIVPPVLIVASHHSLSEQNRQGTSRLLASEYPFKLVIIDTAEDGSFTTTESVLTAVVQKNAYVMQGSLGSSSNMFDGLHEGLHSSKPALFCLHTSNAGLHHGYGAFKQLSALALSSRAFPFIKYKPKSDFFGSSIDLESNPSPNEAWHSEKLPYVLDEESKELDYRVTWADWAFSMKVSGKHFEKYEGSDGVQVAEYLELEESGRKGKTPVVIRIQNKDIRMYSVSEHIISICEKCADNWNTWRELAGMITEFPKKLKQQVSAELSEKYEREMQQLKTDYESQLHEQAQVQQEEIRLKIRSKLVELSKQRKN